ncbi:MAG TPA: ATP-binding protein [Terriglobia bacterium]|nr:ATP-binding protein [Terriglobia bacterium]
MKAKFVLGFAFIATATAFVIHRDYTQASYTWKIQLTDTAARRAWMLGNSLQETQDDAQVLANFTPTTLLLKEKSGDQLLQRDADFTAVLRLLDDYRSVYEYDGVCLFDPQGQVVVRVTDSAALKSLVQSPQEKEIILDVALNRRVRADLLTSQAERVLAVTMPVLDYASPGEPLVGVVAIFDPLAREFLPLLTAEGPATQTGETLLLSLQDGKASYASSLRQPSSAFAENRPSYDTLREAARSAVDTKPAFGTYIDYRGAPVLAAIQKIPSLRGVVASKIDRHEALRSFRSTALLETITAIAVLIVYLSSIVGYERNAAAREMKEKWRQQQAILAERLRAEELLRESNQELESRVSQRTAALTQANELLQESEEKLRLFVEHAPAAIAMLDRDMRYLAASRRWRADFRLSDDGLVGFSHYDLFPGMPERWKEAHRRCLGGAVERCEEDPFRRADGTTEWLHWEVRPWRGTEGKIAGIVIFCEFITGRKRQEEQIRASLQEKEMLLKELEAFAYSVAHDLRAPLRHMGGFLALLVKHSSGQLDDTARRYLDRVTAASRNMGLLIDDLLRFSRLGRTEMGKTAVRLEGLVQEVRLEFEGENAGRKIAWEIGRLPEVMADPSMLHLVMMNLISNALKFTRTRAEARIEIGCSQGEKGEDIIFVKDNGVGFDAQYYSKLFKVFQRLHSGDNFEGTGVGLANVRRIIERHGGRVWAESVGGAGATFSFSLPRSVSDSSPL